LSERKLFIVSNPFSGKRNASKILKSLFEFLSFHKVSFQHFDTRKEKNATATLAKHLDSSFTELVIVGGDGTLNEAINGLKYEIPVSIIPAGTGNDFVKNVAIGKNLGEYFETVLNGEIKKIDLGKCNDRIFLNGVGIGFDGQIVEDMIRKRVPLLSGHAAYYYHVLRILGTYRVRPFKFQMDSGDFARDLIILTVGNGTTFGGGFKLMPNARVDDGELDVCEIGDLSPLRRFLNVHRLSNGTHGNLKEVKFYRTKQLQIDSNPLLFAHLDGEWMGQPPFDIKILPGTMNLRVASSST
jgi:YegS/Rv2252/BmrU family lipid kinase